MENVKLRKDVEFEKLLEYGFEYDEINQKYVRPLKWAFSNVAIQLTVDMKTREVYTLIAKTKNRNKNLVGVNDVALHSSTLIKISHLCEIVVVDE